MNVVLNNENKNYLLTLYCLYVIFLSASCSNFFITVQAQVIFIFFSVILLIKKKQKWLADKTGLILFLSFALVVFLHYIISGVFMLGSIKFFSMILCIYYVINEYRFLFFKKLFDLIYYLTLITIPFYFLQLLSVGLLRSIMSPFNFSFSSQLNAGGVYVFLFNLSPDGWGDWYRNSGFMWEPGAFGGTLIFAIAYYFLQNNYKVNKRIVFLMLYTLTTVSTAAIIALVFFLALIVFSKYKKQTYLIYFYIILLIGFAINIYNLPFMGDKIKYYTETNLDYKYAYTVGNFDEGTSIGRFAGFMIELDRLKKSPIIGNGWDNNYSDLGIGNEWSNPSGLSVLLGKFGITGLLFILVGIYYCTNFNGNGAIYQNLFLFIILLIPLFSNPFQINLIFWSFVMLGIVNFKNRGINKLLRQQKNNRISIYEKSNKLVV